MIVFLVNGFYTLDLSHIHSLDLNGNSLFVTDTFLVTISQQCLNLRRLMIAFCEVFQVVALVQLIQQCKQLSILDIAWCKNLYRDDDCSSFTQEKANKKRVLNTILVELINRLAWFRFAPFKDIASENLEVKWNQEEIKSICLEEYFILYR